MPERIAIISIIASFFTGGAAGSIITFFATGHRDRTARKRSFLASVCKWRAEIASNVPKNCEWPHSPFVQRWFSDKIPDFVRDIEIARSAFDGAAEFDSMTSAVTKLTNQDWKQRQARDVILETLDELIDEIHKYVR